MLRAYAAAAAPAHPSAEKPNILLVVVDTLRADRLSMERDGKPIMPAMSALADVSWNFTHATAQATWTRPSMASLFTSLYPGVHNQQFGIRAKLVEGQDHTADVLPAAIETMASYFKQAGYATFGVQTNPNLHPAFGISQGFDRYEMVCEGDYGGDITQLALDMVDEIDGPFFLYVHYFYPHAPYEPKEAYRRIFGIPPALSESDRGVIENYIQGYYLKKLQWDFGFRSQPPETRLSSIAKEYVKHMYDCEVRCADDEAARLIHELRQRHPEAAAVFTADHGEELWERGVVGHGQSVFEEVAHVPLFLSFPQMQPRVIHQRVELIDVLPTLAAHAGLPPRPWWQGRNLLETTSSNADRPVFTQTRTSVRESNRHLVGVLHQNWKLIADLANGSHWLYDLSRFPREREPLPRADTIEEMKSMLQEHLLKNQRHPLHRPPSTETPLSPEMERNLRSLGYL